MRSLPSRRLHAKWANVICHIWLLLCSLNIIFVSSCQQGSQQNIYPKRTSCINTTLISLPLSEAREEKPLVVDILSSSCCERLSLISLTKEKPVEKGPGAEEVEGWEKMLLDVPMFGGETSSGGKWRWERLRGGRERTYSWKLRDARLVVGSMQERKKQLSTQNKDVTHF